MRIIEHYIRAIRRVYPDFEITEASLDETGQNNAVLLVNGTFIFRFPKYAEGREQLAREFAILQGIRGYITLPIPEPRFLNFGSHTTGEAFLGYPLIPGEPLRTAILQTIRDEAKRNVLAVQLANFLRELHQVPAASAIAYALEVRDTVDEWTGIFARIQAKLFQYMRADAVTQVTSDFEVFLCELEKWDYVPTLKHGDFGPTNILFDSDACAIRGIIDFGGSGLGDPAYDVAGLLGYGEPFVRRLIEAYPEVELQLDRARFYRKIFPLLEALSGIENGDIATFKSGLADYC